MLVIDGGFSQGVALADAERRILAFPAEINSLCLVMSLDICFFPITG